MKFKIFETYEEASAYSAELLAEVIRTKRDAVLGLATGSSPEGMYKEIIRRYEAGDVDFSQVKSVNLDEYVGLTGDHDQSYRYFMDTHLFNHVNINKANTHVPQGVGQDLAALAKAYDELIENLGGIDVQVLGIGANGHIGFNEPEHELHLKTHVAELKPETIEANARFFESREDVPTKAVTMGIGAILSAKKIILIASGESKAEAVKALEDDFISTHVPATLLKLHADVTVVLDQEAASLLTK